ncbi:hypothetical protein MAUB1S_11414 [Mycolicibacterium aubagnense]
MSEIGMENYAFRSGRLEQLVRSNVDAMQEAAKVLVKSKSIHGIAAYAALKIQLDLSKANLAEIDAASKAIAEMKASLAGMRP